MSSCSAAQGPATAAHCICPCQPAGRLRPASAHALRECLQDHWHSLVASNKGLQPPVLPARCCCCSSNCTPLQSWSDHGCGLMLRHVYRWRTAPRWPPGCNGLAITQQSWQSRGGSQWNLRTHGLLAALHVLDKAMSRCLLHSCPTAFADTQTVARSCMKDMHSCLHSTPVEPQFRAPTNTCEVAWHAPRGSV